MKLIPTFKSDKAERNCKFCMFFWTVLIMFLSVNSIADEEVIGYTKDIDSNVPTSYLYLTKEHLILSESNHVGFLT